MIPDGHGDETRKTQQAREPRSHERPEKPEQHRNDEAASGPAGNRARDRAADPRDDEVEDKLEDGHGCSFSRVLVAALRRPRALGAWPDDAARSTANQSR